MVGRDNVVGNSFLKDCGGKFLKFFYFELRIFFERCNINNKFGLFEIAQKSDRYLYFRFVLLLP